MRRNHSEHSVPADELASEPLVQSIFRPPSPPRQAFKIVSFSPPAVWSAFSSLSSASPGPLVACWCFLFIGLSLF